ncbi:MAG: DUF2975 domain-containing protein [Olleya sp.]
MKTKQILDIMKIVSWIIFIGLCIKAGALIISFFVSLLVNPEAASNLYLGLNLSEIYNSNKTYYIITVLYIISIAALKAYLFYWVIKIFLKINLEQPFSLAVGRLINTISYIALSIGLTNLFANAYAEWLVNKGINYRLTFESSEFLFLAGILFVIGLLFKRGIEMQQENELTI